MKKCLLRISISPAEHTSAATPRRFGGRRKELSCAAQIADDRVALKSPLNRSRRATSAQLTALRETFTSRRPSGGYLHAMFIPKSQHGAAVPSAPWFMSASAFPPLPPLPAVPGVIAILVAASSTGAVPVTAMPSE